MRKFDIKTPKAEQPRFPFFFLKIFFSKIFKSDFHEIRFQSSSKLRPFLLKTLQFSQYLIKIFQIFCGSSLTHRKYFHQISLNLEHMEIYAAVLLIHFFYYS